jgi:hypothetical protein
VRGKTGPNWVRKVSNCLRIDRIGDDIQIRLPSSELKSSSPLLVHPRHSTGRSRELSKLANGTNHGEAVDRSAAGGGDTAAEAVAVQPRPRGSWRHACTRPVSASTAAAGRKGRRIAFSSTARGCSARWRRRSCRSTRWSGGSGAARAAGSSLTATARACSSSRPTLPKSLLTTTATSHRLWSSGASSRRSCYLVTTYQAYVNMFFFLFHLLHPQHVLNFRL